MASTPSNLRATNRQRLMQTLWRLGSASRADLAKAAGMSSVTAGKIVDDLLHQGLLTPAEAPPSEPSDPEGAGPTRGRPGQLIQLDRDRPRFVALQMGVAHTRATLATAGGHDTDRWNITTDTPPTFTEWFTLVRDLLRPMVQTPGLWGLLLSVSGVVDESVGRVLYSPNMHSSENIDLPELFGRFTDLPVIVVQEIRALAMGHLSADPQGTDFLLVDFGQGVGGAAVIGGRLFLGALPMSGEIGHTPIAGNDRPCGCGGVGCLETLISRNALMRAAGVRQWTELQRVLSENPLPDWLCPILDDAARTIAGACNALGLQRVVLTGSLTELPAPVVQRICDGIHTGSIASRFGTMNCQSAPRRRIAGLVRVGLEKLVPVSMPEN